MDSMLHESDNIGDKTGSKMLTTTFHFLT